MPTRSGGWKCRYDAFTEEFSSISAAARERANTPGRPEAHGASVVPGGRRLMGEINVVPYIDVMLVLLIIFMVAAPLVMQGVKVDLPKAFILEPLTADLLREQNNPLVLSIDRGGPVLSGIWAGIRTRRWMRGLFRPARPRHCKNRTDLPVLLEGRLSY